MTRCLAAACAAALSAFAALAATPEPAEVRRILTGPRDIGDCFRDAAVDAVSEPGVLRLRRYDWIVTTTGNKLRGGTGGTVALSDQLLARKTFDLGGRSADGADIFVFGSAARATLNGTPIEFGAFPHHSGWAAARVPASSLRPGANQLVIGGGRLAQDRETRPETCSLSRDGGATWVPAEGGDFLIHIRLHRYPATGTATLAVVDLANPDEADVVCPLVRVRSVGLAADKAAPREASVVLEGRTGPTPWPDETWSDWRPADALVPARFVQARATLRSASGAATPRVTRVEVRASVERLANPSEQGLRLVSAMSPHLVRSSWPYEFQRPSPKLRELRERYRLDEVIAPGRDQMEQFILLRDWVRRQWPCNDAGSGVRSWDALEILGAAENQHGMCVHFATAFYQCALALGFNARPVILTGHFVADIWSDELGKWILMDVESVEPEGFRRHGTAHYIDPATGTPLSGLEIHEAVRRAIASGTPAVTGAVQVYALDGSNGAWQVSSVTRNADKSMRCFRSLAYPPRNNYLDRLDPWEEHHGENHYHSNAYLWWRIEQPEEQDAHYSWSSDRAGDLMWTVNRARLVPTATDRPGVLSVALDTVTPNLKGFLYRTNGSAWTLAPGRGQDPDSRRDSIDWKLAPGKNKLDVKTVNAFDREGRTSSLEVEWSP